MRKVIPYIAMTLDGMIADSNYGMSFLDHMVNLNGSLRRQKQIINRTDTILMMLLILTSNSTQLFHPIVKNLLLIIQ